MTGKKKSRKLRVNLKRRAEIGEERREKTRQQLHDAAFICLGVKEGRWARIEDICKAANISRGTFYNYYDSVEDLFEDMSYNISHDFNEQVLRTTSLIDNRLERISAGCRYYLKLAMSEPSWGWTMVNVSANSIIFGKETESIVHQTVKDAVNSGDLGSHLSVLGGEIILGSIYAAMITVLNQSVDKDYPEQITEKLLVTLGVEKNKAKRLTETELAKLR